MRAKEKNAELYYISPCGKSYSCKKSGLSHVSECKECLSWANQDLLIVRPIPFDVHSEILELKNKLKIASDALAKYADDNQRELFSCRLGFVAKEALSKLNGDLK